MAESIIAKRKREQEQEVRELGIQPGGRPIQQAPKPTKGSPEKGHPFEKSLGRHPSLRKRLLGF